MERIEAIGSAKTYRCGTLTYTKAGLFILFGWLLWGDFCFTLMEAVVPNILPLKLKTLGAQNWLIGVIMATAPGFLNMSVCPWVSFKSDRFRSRWGRRIPFIVVTMPFLCFFLGALGWNEELSALLRSWLPVAAEVAPATMTIALIAVLLVSFQFFNMFVGSVFIYLFNDVVPPQMLGRFSGAMRIVGIGAGAVFNWFVFRHAETHMREIFTGAALLYLIGFGLMFLFVKEGQYPPVEGETDRESKGWGGLKTFFRESFSHKFYWFRFLATAFSAIAASMSAAFNVFYLREMGLDLAQIGKTVAITSCGTMAAIFLMAAFVDRWHPLRLTVYAGVFSVIGNVVLGVWLFVTLPSAYYFWIGVGGALSGILLTAVCATAGLPLEMRIFPQSRFGQFCSAQSLLRSTCTAASGVLAGLFIDLMRRLCGDSDFAYRFNFVWATVFGALAAFFMVLLYIEWNKMGGDKHFHPPAPWNPKGFEEMPVTKTVGPQSRWLGFAFLCFDGIMALSAILTPLMAWLMHSRGQLFAAKAYLLLILPLSLLAWGGWILLKRSIWRDVASAREGRPPVDGIPHHGVLFLVGAKYLLLFGVWIAEIIATVSLSMESGAVAFGVTRVVTNLLLIGAIWLICRIERGFSTSVDETPYIIPCKN